MSFSIKNIFGKKKQDMTPEEKTIHEFRQKFPSFKKESDANIKRFLNKRESMNQLADQLHESAQKEHFVNELNKGLKKISDNEFMKDMNKRLSDLRTGKGGRKTMNNNKKNKGRRTRVKKIKRGRKTRKTRIQYK
jgi:hypothetical protein